MSTASNPPPNPPVSARPFHAAYADVYWLGGPSEKQGVFIEGAGLPMRLAQGGPCTVAELGFGTGVSAALVLAAAAQAPAGTPVTYIGYEAHPLPPATLAAIHASLAEPWATQLAPYLPALAQALHSSHAGWNSHTLALPSGQGVAVHLWLGEAAAGLPTQPFKADIWFMDGHAPAKNPTMWSAEICQHMAAQSHAGARVATYTAARMVAENLRAAGFQVAKVKGNPPKRHQLHAHWPAKG